MGTGGLKPTSNNDISQYVTFYNTTGIIEKDKGIYFCPLLPKVTTGPQAHVEVSAIWKSKFEAVASHTSDYSSILISKWSPRDRSLVVKGLPDDFRVVSVSGRAFNYMILTRNVEPSSAFASYYDGFFITDVQQAGIGSVRITLEPDNFTNMFYLHNTKQCIQYGEPTTEDPYIDVFNERLKNCYVNKQHYNRIKKVGSRYKQDNLKIFSLIEESFKYKRQFRDYKKYLNYGNPVSDSEIAIFKETETWNDLSASLKQRALELSTAFFHVTLKDKRWLILLDRVSPYGTGQYLPEDYLPNSTVLDNLIHLVTPICIPPDYLSHLDVKSHFLIDGYCYSFNNNQYERISRGGDFNVIGTNGHPTLVYNDNTLLSAMQVFTRNSNLTLDVVSSYISRESSITKYITYESTGLRVKVKGTSDGRHKDDLNFVGVPYLNELSETDQETLLENYIKAGQVKGVLAERNTELIQDFTYAFNWGNTPSTLQTTELVLFVEADETMQFELDLDDQTYLETATQLKSKYFDPTLTFNPYSFYSVSYLGRVEVPLNKLNYYDNPAITCELVYSISDVFKMTFIPTYEIENKAQKMYSESIEQTLTNHVTILTSALSEYVVSNNAQMKNQYAVNDLNHEYGLVEAGIGAVGSIGKGIAMAGITGGASVVSGAVSGGVNIVNDLISWDRDTRQIAMNQKAKLADMGNMPSNLKQVGTDIVSDLALNELGLHLNHYTIDELSKNSICKYLERFGYTVNLYDDLHVNDRVGWNFIKLVSFDYDGVFTTEEEDSVRQILENGVTLLHDTTVLHDKTKHNYETILNE